MHLKLILLKNAKKNHFEIISFAQNTFYTYGPAFKNTGKKRYLCIKIPARAALVTIPIYSLYRECSSCLTCITTPVKLQYVGMYVILSTVSMMCIIFFVLFRDVEFNLEFIPFQNLKCIVAICVLIGTFVKYVNVCESNAPDTKI